ncbi:hypothetical protein PR003_g20707 [Phytophthora rubi]|uniref:Uncharacterized protein n=1 Tax=Phytophthora rubi TaxID=129364 RepID=A0A6A3JLP1_9STRA|nr:hypothetical protein PR002_g20359 [Phytophthora rubi]KAE8996418.1 hypothetical protein PR001_g19868 [Phytophthora rubi]KAE9308593.1 hypothetical protein PR003_g20707 [Phytophthora rubi]
MLIVDVDDDEFIVGSDLLVTIGIDLDRLLKQLCGHGDDDTSGDPIELEADDIPLILNEPQSSDDDIFAAVERLINRAVVNGFPLGRVATEGHYACVRCVALGAACGPTSQCAATGDTLTSRGSPYKV